MACRHRLPSRDWHRVHRPLPFRAPLRVISMCRALPMPPPHRHHQQHRHQHEEYARLPDPPLRRSWYRVEQTPSWRQDHHHRCEHRQEQRSAPSVGHEPLGPRVVGPPDDPPHPPVVSREADHSQQSVEFPHCVSPRADVSRGLSQCHRCEHAEHRKAIASVVRCSIVVRTRYRPRGPPRVDSHVTDSAATPRVHLRRREWFTRCQSCARLFVDQRGRQIVKLVCCDYLPLELLPQFRITSIDGWTGVA